MSIYFNPNQPFDPMNPGLGSPAASPKSANRMVMRDVHNTRTGRDVVTETLNTRPDESSGRTAKDVAYEAAAKWRGNNPNQPELTQDTDWRREPSVWTGKAPANQQITVPMSGKKNSAPAPRQQNVGESRTAHFSDGYTKAVEDAANSGLLGQ